MLGEKVTESVIFLLQDEVRGVGHAWETGEQLTSIRVSPGFLPEKTFSSIFFSPSSRMKSSKLQVR
jgi:hypothetical protein